MLQSRKSFALVLSYMWAPLWAMHQENPVEEDPSYEVSASDTHPMITIPNPLLDPTAQIGAKVTYSTGSIQYISAESRGIFCSISNIDHIQLFQLPKLKYLAVCYNTYANSESIKTLSATSFPNLTSIILMGNNLKKFSLGQETFQDLTEIQLSDNKLDSIEFLEFTPNIQSILMRNNKIPILNFRSAKNFNHLTTLNVSRNLIRSLESLAWIDWPALKDLNIEDNPLTSCKGLDKARMPNLIELSLKRTNVEDAQPITRAFFELTRLDLDAYTHALCKLSPPAISAILKSPLFGNDRSRNEMRGFLKEQAILRKKPFEST